MGKISTVITVIAGEEDILHRALSSVKNFSDEIVVVDLGEGSKLDKLAKDFNLKVYKHDFVNFVELVRNFGISKAKGDWILILDPDEEIPEKLAKSLTKKTNENSVTSYYRLPRKNIIFGEWIKHSGWWPDYNIRFFKRGSVSWSEIIHKVPFTHGKGEEIPANEDLAILHHHYSSLSQYISQMDRYTSVQTDLLLKNDYSFSYKDLVIKPLEEFLSRYFANEGYKDGLHGLALSGLQSFSEFLLYLKLWEVRKFAPEKINLEEIIKIMKNLSRQFSYWQSDALVKENNGLVERIRRKFKI